MGIYVSLAASQQGFSKCLRRKATVVIDLKNNTLCIQKIYDEEEKLYFEGFGFHDVMSIEQGTVCTLSRRNKLLQDRKSHKVPLQNGHLEIYEDEFGMEEYYVRLRKEWYHFSITMYPINPRWINNEYHNDGIRYVAKFKIAKFRRRYPHVVIDAGRTRYCEEIMSVIKSRKLMTAQLGTDSGGLDWIDLAKLSKKEFERWLRDPYEF